MFSLHYSHVMYVIHKVKETERGMISTLERAARSCGADRYDSSI